MKLRSIMLPLVALSFSFVNPCQKAPDKGLTPAPSDKIFDVSVIHPEFKSISKTHSVDGTIDVSAVNTVTAAGPGALEQIFVNEGDTVAQGDPLTTISNTELMDLITIKRAKVTEVQAKLDEVRARLEGSPQGDQPTSADDNTFLDEDATDKPVKTPFGPADATVTPPKTLAAMVTYLQARVDTLTKQADELDHQLQSLSQVSAVNGVVTKIIASKGNRVNAQDKILEISTTNPMSVTFFLPENVASHIYKTAKVSVTPTTASDLNATGTVYFISPNIDTTTSTFEIRAHIDNPDGRIKGNQKANVQVATNRMDRVVVLPKNVIAYENSKPTIFIVYKDQAKQINVTLGDATDDGQVQVYGDLRVDDPIIVGRPADLKNNSFVKIISP